MLGILGGIYPRPVTSPTGGLTRLRVVLVLLRGFSARRVDIMRFCRGTGSLLLVVLFVSPSLSAVTVFLDFDGQWQANLAAVAATAGVPAFNLTETLAIQDAILAEFSSQLAAFDVQLTAAEPGGFRERVHFGAQTASTNQLGSSMVDFQNTFASTASIYSANFGFIVEPDDDRNTQIAELSMALAGTGLHELGHSFGLRHHDAYGDTRITPNRYADTQGIQNQHLMGTGPTGITEQQREQSRSYSQWSQVIMEAAVNLTPQPIPLQFETTDAGDTPSTAQLLGLSSREISDTDAGFVFATLASELDVDLFAFDVLHPSQLTAEIWSQGLFAFIDDFDSELRLLGPDGVTILAANDQIRYAGNTFDDGTVFETDSMLLNIPLEVPGRYYLQVSSNGTVTDPDGGGIYQMLLALAAPVPEPMTSAGLPFLIAILAGWVRSGAKPSAIRRTSRSSSS